MIGFADANGNLIKNQKDVELVFPYKDAVLAGGQTKDDQKRKEVFYNELLDDKEITNLLAPKVLCNALAFDKENPEGKPVTEFNNENLIIRGNNLLALSSIKERYAGQIKCIYIDPPYNTGGDSFGYNDSFNHSTWMTFIKNRLEIAKELLRDDGVSFISCDDNEQAYLKVLCDGIFGRENFISTLVWLKGNAQNDAETIQRNQEYITCYSKNITTNPISKLKYEVIEKVFFDEKSKRFYYEGSGITTGGEGGTLNARTNLGFTIYYNKENGDFIGIEDYDKVLAKTCNDEKIVYKDDEELLGKGYIIIRPPKKGNKLGCWTWEVKKFNNEKDKIIIRSNKTGYTVLKKEWIDSKLVKKDEKGGLFANLEKALPPKSFIDFVGAGNGTSEVKNIFGNKIFRNPKSEKLINYFIEISTQPGDLVLDFFLGSGTTAAVAHKMGRRYIGIEQMDYIKTITVERLKKVIAGEQGGISKAVDWNGGGSFVFCELAELNQKYADKIQSCKTEEEITALTEEIKNSDYISTHVIPSQINTQIQEYKDLSLEEKKQFAMEILDKNMLYINASDMEDKSFNVNDADKSFTQSFYSKLSK